MCPESEDPVGETPIKTPEQKSRTEQLFDAVRALGLPAGKFVIIGSGPLGARGIKECGDVDVLVTQDVWDEYRTREGWRLKQKAPGKTSLDNGQGIELWYDRIPGTWDVERLIAEADIINGLPFDRLQNIREWKKLYDRPKDKGDIEAIDRFLAEREKLV